MIELQVIDGQVFIQVCDDGKSRTVTPTDAINFHRQRITDAEARLRDLSTERTVTETLHQEAVFFGEPSTELRSKLADISRQMLDAQALISSSQKEIMAINAAVNRYQAQRIASEHAQHLALLVAPFDKVLMESQL